MNTIKRTVVALSVLLLALPSVNAQELDAAQKAKARQNAVDLQERQAFAEVKELLNAKKSKEAIEKLTTMYTEGSPNAPLTLAHMYWNGKDIKKNRPLALEWFKRASQKGNGYASYELGRFYFLGEGVEQNYVTAAQWFEHSRQPEALYILGCMYLEGVGVEKNPSSAVKFFKASAEQGHATAKGALGEISYVGLGFKRSAFEANKWLSEAVKHNDPKALFYMEKMYASGDGVEKNEEKAAEYGKTLQQWLASYKESKSPLDQLKHKEWKNLPERLARLQGEAQIVNAEKERLLQEQLKAHANAAVQKPSTAAVAASRGKAEPPRQHKELATIYSEVEGLVHEYFPKAKLTKTDDKLHFEFKLREYGNPFRDEKGLIAPALDGVLGDLEVKKGKPGVDLPKEENETFYVTWVMAPYSPPKDSHLVARLLFSPTANVTFLKRFKDLVNSY